jgi:hypothetical protein
LELFAPIIEREFRAAIRRRGLLKERFWSAVIGAGLTGFFLLISFFEHSSTWGRTLFQWLLYPALFLAVIRPAQASVGLFTEERQSQTLELLALAGLRPMEIFFSKLIGGVLVGSSALLALIPYFAVPFISGGVGFQSFVGSIVCMPTLLLFVTAAAVLASVICSDDGAAMILTVVIVGVLGLAVPVPFVLGRLIGGVIPFSPSWLCLSPGRAPFLLSSGYGSLSVSEFWPGILMTYCWTLMIFLAASFVFARNWRNNPEVSPPAQFWKRVTRLGSRSRGYLLEMNPFQWLVQYDRRSVTLAWTIVFGLCALWLAGWCAWGNLWPSTMNSFITIFLLIMVRDWTYQHAAARRIGEDRKEGRFELLLTTPLRPQEIVQGEIEGLREQFNPLNRTLFALGTALMLSGFLSRSWNTQGLVSYAAIWALLLGWCLRHPRQIPSTMWVALITGRSLAALFRSSGSHGWRWFWILFNLRNIRLGSGVVQFPKGSTMEMIIVLAVTLIIALIVISSQMEAPNLKDRLIKEMRDMAQDPVPDPHDPRFKKWNGKDRLPAVNTTVKSG